MDESERLRIRMKRKNLRVIKENADKIHSLFAVRLTEKPASEKQDVSGSDYVFLNVEREQSDRNEAPDEIIQKVKNYIESLCEDDRTSCGGEDSSYDSDCDNPEVESHNDVSRTVSDTLGEEYAEYVSSYNARVEFALKLGYTVPLVQAALQKLGPNPGQNELLEELIKLGAQSRTVDFPADDEETDQLQTTQDDSSNLRLIVIDGSNVAMSHGNKETFSCRGIKLCVDWFRSRGHKEITVFVPKWRKESSRSDNRVTDPEILRELERDRLLVFTPSRVSTKGKRMVCYDDRYILRLAADVDGIVVSNDNYRDLAQENPEFRKVVEERILMYSFVNDRFMPPDDPLGRSGPTLENFLRKQPKRTEPLAPCPYGKKCTYGNKCKFHHPERGPLPHKSVTERLVEHAQKQIQEVKARGIRSRDSSPGEHLKGKSLSLPLPCTSTDKDGGRPAIKKTPLSRTKSNVPESSHLSVPSMQVSKSKSVENVAGEGKLSASVDIGPFTYSSAQPVPEYNQQQFWSHSERWPQHAAYKNQGTGLVYGDQSGHVAVAKCISDSDNNSGMDAMGGVNLHRKLQRQLTLNPSYDPRLYQMRGFIPPYGPPPMHDSSGPRPDGGAEFTERQPLVRHDSAGPQYTGLPPGWDHLPAPHHPNVTRISSDPDSFRQWPTQNPRHMQRLSSTSDPQLNLYGAGMPDAHLVSDPFENSPWPPVPPPVVPSRAPAWPQPPFPTARSTSDEARNRLYYHLSSLFPAEQVQAAMQLYPDETNPQKICAAILGMFSKS